MRVVARVVLVTIVASAASAQDAPPPRMIPPDRFHPYSQGDLGGPGSAAPIVMPTKERPFGACDAKTHDWIACLTATAAQSEQIVDEAEQSARVALTKRRGLNPCLQKTQSEARTRIDAEWRRSRDRECDALAMLERGLPTQVYEARLTCRILRKLERGETLTARYGGG